MPSALNRKLLRETTRLKGQVATIALVVASGITSFIALRSTWRSLEWSRDLYYDQCRFADVFAHLERAPEGLLAGLGLEVALALPIGLVLGRWWADQFMGSTLDSETFRFSVYIAPSTYGAALLVAVLAAAGSALWVRRSLDRLDLIAVLKTRE